MITKTVFFFSFTFANLIKRFFILFLSFIVCVFVWRKRNDFEIPFAWAVLGFKNFCFVVSVLEFYAPTNYMLMIEMWNILLVELLNHDESEKMWVRKREGEGKGEI